MKKVIFILISILSCHLSFGQTAIKDLLDAINWNQKEQDFINQWSGQLVKVKHFYNDAGKWYRDYEFHDVYLNDMELTFGVGINEEDHSIRSIHGSFVSSNSDLDTFNKADRLLRNIYGTPYDIKDKLKDEFIKTKTLTWYNDSYELELDITFYSSGYCSLHLTATKHATSTHGEHFTFKGIPIMGATKDFASKLRDKGYTMADSSDDNIIFLSGAFAGYDDVTIAVVGTPKSNTVYKVVVFFGKKDSFSSLETQYNSLLKSYTDKYGKPEESYSFFSSPYYKGDGFELQALKKEKCNYISFFSVDNGHLIIEISKTQQVSVTYEDIEGDVILKREKKMIINDDI